MSRRRTDRALQCGFRFAAVVASSIVVLILIFVLWEAAPALITLGIGPFLTDPGWQPTSSEETRYGVGAMLAASLSVTFGAVAVAGVPGVLSALFIRFYAPRSLAAVYRRIIELLAGIPSVVFGFWGLVVLVPVINRVAPPGQSLLAGILVLSLMVMPTIVVTADSSLRSVPASYSQAAAALGLGRWTMLWNITLPVARRGIAAGLLLAAARAVGETMAVVMVCGNIIQVPGSLFAPVRTVTANIAMEMGEAQAEHRSALFVTGLLLMLLVSGFLIVAGSARRSNANG